MHRMQSHGNDENRPKGIVCGLQKKRIFIIFLIKIKIRMHSYRHR